jgi:soluble lytic murein transglycosylase
MACSLASVWVNQKPSQAITFPTLNFARQMAQARELLNRAPQSSDLASAEPNTRDFVIRVIKSSLPPAYQWQANDIAHSLIIEANRHELDPIFLLAVMKTESRFHPEAKGRHGEIGLMQLLPKTAAWVAKTQKWHSKKLNLYDPIINIRVGAAYLAILRKHFSRVGSRYVSAYNMGPRNVHKLLRADVEPKVYAGKVLANYRGLYSRWSETLPKKANFATLN